MCTTLAVDARPVSLSLAGAIPRRDLFTGSQIAQTALLQVVRASPQSPRSQGWAVMEETLGCPWRGKQSGLFVLQADTLRDGSEGFRAALVKDTGK